MCQSFCLIVNHVNLFAGLRRFEDREWHLLLVFGSTLKTETVLRIQHNTGH